MERGGERERERRLEDATPLKMVEDGEIDHKPRMLVASRSREKQRNRPSSRTSKRSAALRTPRLSPSETQFGLMTSRTVR